MAQFIREATIARLARDHESDVIRQLRDDVTELKQRLERTERILVRSVRSQGRHP